MNLKDGSFLFPRSLSLSFSFLSFLIFFTSSSFLRRVFVLIHRVVDIMAVSVVCSVSSVMRFVVSFHNIEILSYNPRKSVKYILLKTLSKFLSCIYFSFSVFYLKVSSCDNFRIHLRKKKLCSLTILPFFKGGGYGRSRGGGGGRDGG